MLVNLTAMG